MRKKDKPYCEGLRTGAAVEEWLNAESPDTWPYLRRPTCDRIALALALLEIVEEEAPEHEPHWMDCSASEQVTYTILKDAKDRVAHYTGAKDGGRSQ